MFNLRGFPVICWSLSYYFYEQKKQLQRHETKVSAWDGVTTRNQIEKIRQKKCRITFGTFSMVSFVASCLYIIGSGNAQHIGTKQLQSG